MHSTEERHEAATRICLSAGVLLMAVTTQLCWAVEPLPPAVKAALDRVRNTRAGLYDSVDSSVLGRTASPAEIAATQRNLRRYYMTPAPSLKLSEARRQQLGALYGRVTLLGRPRAGKAFALGITGAHVIDVEGRPELVVTRVDPQTPAAAALKQGDVIVGANQRLFPEWEDPRVPVGYAIAAAQTRAFRGTLTLHIGRDGRFLSVDIKLPIDGGWGEAWPFGCKKSEAVAAAAVDYVLERGDDTFWRDLFLMGVGDRQAMAHVRDNLRKAQRSGVIGSNWHGGYKLLCLTEYYLLTRDPEVLPAIRAHVKGLEANQMACGGWSHGPPGGYGVMNQVGQICFIGLVLARECGVEVDPEVLARGVNLSGRFIGTYGAYGDHAPGVAKYGKHAPFDNGIVPAHAALFHLLGEEAVARRSGRRSCYLYRTRMGGHAELIFSIAWSSVGAAFAPEAEFRMYADHMIWYYELARQRSGALTCLGHTRYRRSTAALGMVFALAEKRLRIAGAPRRSQPLFPIETLGPAQPVKAQPQPQPPPAVAAKATSPDTWDALVAAPDAEYRCLAADQLQPDERDAWYGPGWDDDAWKRVKSGAKPGDMPGGTLLRRSFKCAEPDYTTLRVTLPVGVGGELFLNGDRVAVFSTYRPPRGGKGLQTLDLGRRAAGALRQGENLLAARIEGLGKHAIRLGVAAGPGVIEKRSIEAHPPDYGNNNRNGWVGTYEQHRQGVAWFFEGKSPEQVARYLAFPDWMGAQAAYLALASHGREALPLLTRLVADSHAGVRVGAWDAIGAMNEQKRLTEQDQQKLAALAASRIAREDPVVGEALGRAAAPMAKGEALAKILAAIAAKPDIKARQFAVDNAQRGLADRPELMIAVLRVVAASGLEHSTIRVLGGAMSGISRHAELPEARGAAKEIARVLDEIAPDMRGMFTDGLMHGGLAVIDQHFDAELEATPKLVSGMARCFIKVPDTDWPGWAFANLYLRRQLYRLGAGSAGEIRRTVEAMMAGEDTGRGEAVRRQPPATELKAWAALLEQTKGDADALRTQALRMSGSADPVERVVALSLVWPSQQTLADQSARYHGRRKLADVARIQDPNTRLMVAIRAAEHLKTNTPVHWLLIWETAMHYRDRREHEGILISLAAFFDTVAFRQRGTFMFRAIDSAASLAKPQLGTAGETPTLARGLCKTYATSSNFEWYTRTRDKLRGLVKALGKPSAPAIRQAVAAQRAWLRDAPKEERDVVLGRHCTPQDVRQRLEELEGIAAASAQPRREETRPLR